MWSTYCVVLFLENGKKYAFKVCMHSVLGVAGVSIFELVFMLAARLLCLVDLNQYHF